MSSASQIDHASTTSEEDQLAQMLCKVKSSRESEVLRARLPAQLAPFASNIRISEPTQTISSSSPRTGNYCCTFASKEQKIFMSVTVVLSPHSQSQGSEEEPHAKPLELTWQEWWMNTSSIISPADSKMSSITLQYGPPGDGMHSKGIAFTGWYDDDSGISQSVSSHGGIISIVDEVVRDMGFNEGELDDKLRLEIIEALLGADGRPMLDSVPKRARDGKVGPALRDVIKGKLEEEDFDDPFS